MRSSSEQSGGEDFELLCRDFLFYLLSSINKWLSVTPLGPRARSHKANKIRARFCDPTRLHVCLVCRPQLCNPSAVSVCTGQGRENRRKQTQSQDSHTVSAEEAAISTAAGAKKQAQSRLGGRACPKQIRHDSREVSAQRRTDWHT